MRKSRKMQRAIERMAKARKLDLSQDEIYFKVQSGGFMDLVVETIGFNQVSVAHYYKQNGDSIQDPEIVFHMANDGEWYAIEQTTPAFMLNGLAFGGYDRVAEIGEGGSYRYKVRAQRDLAIFANKWADNIRRQGFE